MTVETSRARDPVRIDGAMGEGGGQVLRSALALALATGTPFEIEGIRAGRRKPGLLRQHLTAVEAARAIGDAHVEGAQLGSRHLSFTPRALRGGRHELKVGSAGSTALVLQAVLPALLHADEPSTVVVEGGTHARSAPPFEFLRDGLFPLLRRTGAGIEARLARRGYYPAGGGRIEVDIRPARSWSPLELTYAGPRVSVEAVACVARIPQDVADRELQVVKSKLGWPEGALRTERCERPVGPGNALVLRIEHEHVTEVFSAYGRIGLPAETVAREACEQARRWLRADVPVGVHLADQLMVPLALGAGGRYRTGPLTPHSRTNLDVLRAFLDVPVTEEPSGGDRAVVLTIGGRLA